MTCFQLFSHLDYSTTAAEAEAQRHGQPPPAASGSSRTRAGFGPAVRRRAAWGKGASSKRDIADMAGHSDFEFGGFTASGMHGFLPPHTCSIIQKVRHGPSWIRRCPHFKNAQHMNIMGRPSATSHHKRLSKSRQCLPHHKRFSLPTNTAKAPTWRAQAVHQEKASGKKIEKQQGCSRLIFVMVVVVVTATMAVNVAGVIDNINRFAW